MRVALLAIAVGLSGCPRRVPVFGPEGEFTNAALLMETASKRAARTVSARGEAKASVATDGGGGSVTYLFAIDRPDRVRIDALSFFGQPLASLAVAGGRFAHYDLGAQTFTRGEATAAAAGRFLLVEMPPHHLVRILLGDPPVMDGDVSFEGLDADGYRVVVQKTDRLAGAEVVRARQRFRVDTKSLRFLAASGEGWSVEYGAWPEYDPGPAVPGVARIVAGPSRLTLQIRRAEANPSIPDDVFELAPPAGARILGP